LNPNPNGPCPLYHEIACKKYIDNRLVLHKNTPIANKVKTPMHIITKQTQKHTQIANINKCIKVQKLENAKMW
jgi:hypothetical protein